MPPKNKKELEEEAKRLEDQKKRKEEEEALLQQERKKYLAQTLTTNLFLPASNQLILDFPKQTQLFISEKLSQIITQYPHISNTTFIIKEITHIIKDSLSLFNPHTNEQQMLKARVFIGIISALYLSESVGIGESTTLLRQMVINHSIDNAPNKILVFNKEEAVSVVKYAQKTYFSHNQLIQKYRKITKKVQELQKRFYISSPAVYNNTKETPFIDLSNNESKSNVQGQ